MAIVLYWRRRKARAPLKMMSPTSLICGVPVGRFKTFRANKMANTIAPIPDIGTIQNMTGIFPSQISALHG
jgi:hypothetical protein